MDDGSTRMEKATRARVGEEPRSDPLPEWDVFVREDAGSSLADAHEGTDERSSSSPGSQARQDGVMRHVGSVSAPTPEAAHEHASRLFGWFADDVWICESSEIHRFSTHSLGEPGETATPDSGTEPRQHEWDE